jgi:uncharacterized membrane protein (UPF0127 family)
MGSTFFAPLLQRPTAALTIRNQRNGRMLANHLLPAFDSRTRRAGLLHHESLADGHAMLIAPSNAVHTFFMRFSIDLAFITREGRVVKIRASVRPWRVAAAFRAYAVIELPAGTLARCDTIPGDMLAIVPAESSD